MKRCVAATVVFVGVALAGATAVSQTPAPESASLRALRFLAGEWKAVDLAPGEDGGFTFRFAVQDRALVRESYARYPASNDRPASRHDDLMVIFVEGQAMKADYFDNEGHVIHYAVHPQRDRGVVLVSSATSSEPGYRLTYALTDGGVLSGRFEIAPPGSADAFKMYLTWSARKIG
jgi:hypothetical protein